MSDLHFDADGESAKVPGDAEELRVRRFRKPGERGACEVVHGADGAPLFVPVETSYVEFRKLVDNVPGRYRLDPVDGARRACSGAAALYVTIDPPRNAVSGDDRDVVLRELIRANTEQMRASQDVTRELVAEIKSILGAAAEMVRVATGAGLQNRPPPEPTPEDDEDDDDEDEEDVAPTNPLADAVAHFLRRATPLLETYAADRMTASRRGEASTPSAVAQPSPPAAPATAAASAPVAATAPVTRPTSAAPAPTPAAPAPTEPTPVAPTSAQPPAEVRNAPLSPEPTPEQLHHLIAVKSKLSDQEQLVVMTAIPRMDPEARAHWLGELCARSVDDAAALVRSMMPPLRTQKKEHAP
jgi:hypothetical protein